MGQEEKREANTDIFLAEIPQQRVKRCNFTVELTSSPRS